MITRQDAPAFMVPKGGKKGKAAKGMPKAAAKKGAKGKKAKKSVPAFLKEK
jgi:hypothetical protein